jgi:hypothetical protein
VRALLEATAPTGFDDDPKTARRHTVHVLQIPVPRKRQLNPVRGKPMEDGVDEKELVLFLELLIPHIIDLKTVTGLLLEKGIFTKEEFSAKRKRIQQQYEHGLE